jgi:hypothetical protein
MVRLILQYMYNMMLAFPNVIVRNWFETAIKGRYQIVIQDDNITYLGMSVTKTEHGIMVHQSEYIDTESEMVCLEESVTFAL